MGKQTNGTQQQQQQPNNDMNSANDPAPTATADPAPTATADPAPTATADPAPTATADPAPTATADPAPTATADPAPEILELRAEIHELKVSALGILADPKDLPYSPELTDHEALRAAATALITEKPHLRARRAGGDVGQSAQGGSGGEVAVSLADMLRANA